MNFVLRLLSPLMFGLVRRYGPRLAGLDPQRIARNKRRLVGALLLGALGLVLFTTGTLLTMVDLAVQYEQRGFFVWNAILWVSVGVFATGLISLVAAKAMMPGVRDFMPFAPRQAAAARKGVARKSDEVRRPPRRPEYAH